MSLPATSPALHSVCCVFSWWALLMVLKVGGFRCRPHFAKPNIPFGLSYASYCLRNPARWEFLIALLFSFRILCMFSRDCRALLACRSFLMSLETSGVHQLHAGASGAAFRKGTVAAARSSANFCMYSLYWSICFLSTKPLGTHKLSVRCPL